MKTSLARLFSEKFPQKALRSVIGTQSIIGPFTLCLDYSKSRSVIGTLIATEDGQRLVALFKVEFELDMNSDPCIFTTYRRTAGCPTGSC